MRGAAGVSTEQILQFSLSNEGGSETRAGVFDAETAWQRFGVLPCVAGPAVRVAAVADVLLVATRIPSSTARAYIAG